MPPPFITDKWFQGKTRPKNLGKVTIILEEIPHTHEAILRPTAVWGIVAGGATTGRLNATEPIVSEAKRIPTRYRYDAGTGENAYNTGISSPRPTLTSPSVFASFEVADQPDISELARLTAA